MTVIKIDFEIIFPCGNHPKNPQCKCIEKNILRGKKAIEAYVIHVFFFGKGSPTF